MVGKKVWDFPTIPIALRVSQEMRDKYTTPAEMFHEINLAFVEFVKLVGIEKMNEILDPLPAAKHILTEMIP